MTNKEFLRDYINNNSPVGYEVNVGGQKIWYDFVKKYATKVESDLYGNLYAYYGNMDSDFTVLLDAHADEVGFIITDITNDGFIKVSKLGGSDFYNTPANKVNIWTEENGPVKGIFAHPPIHVHGGNYKFDGNNIIVDIGAKNKKEVLKQGISKGNPLTLESEFMTLGKFYVGKSLDDKIGGYINAIVLKKLAKNKVDLPFKLVVVNSVQEEIGLHGAKMSMNKINPDIALVFDVTHCTKSPVYKEKGQNIESGKGLVISNTPQVQKKLFNFIKNIVEDNKIKYQVGIGGGGGTGTNTDSYVYPKGIPTALFSVPLRYMHTTSEMVNKNDVKNMIKLFYKIVTDSKLKKYNKFKQNLNYLN